MFKTNLKHMRPVHVIILTKIYINPPFSVFCDAAKTWKRAMGTACMPRKHTSHAKRQYLDLVIFFSRTHALIRELQNVSKQNTVNYKKLQENNKTHIHLVQIRSIHVDDVGRLENNMLRARAERIVAK
jgi:hypothetical protein